MIKLEMFGKDEQITKKTPQVFNRMTTDTVLQIKQQIHFNHTLETPASKQ